MKDDELKQIVSDISKEGEFADIYVENTQSSHIRCEDNRIEDVVSGSECGAGMRIIKGEEILYGSTSDVNGCGGIKDIARDLLGKKLNNPGGSRINFAEKINARGTGMLKLPGSVPVEKKLEIVNKANSSARAVSASMIRQVLVVYADTVKDTTLINSKGTFVNEQKVYTTFMVRVIAGKGNIVQTSYETLGGMAGFELFDENNVGEIAQKAAFRAVKMLEAKSAPTGEMMVVLSSEAGGTMIHEAIGHSLEADAVQKGISPAYAGKLGKKVSSEIISVADDSTLPGRRGSFMYDDEGNPSERTILVENGILKNYMYDYFTATRDKVKSTANGRRQSYRHAPIPRMTNTLILPGKDSPGEIIKSVKKGLFVKKMGGGQVDTVNGNFVFDVSESYEINNGKKGDLVRGAILIGNGPEILESIDMVGNDLGFNIGTCGKDGQGVPVADAQPTLRIPVITVGGTG